MPITARRSLNALCVLGRAAFLSLFLLGRAFAATRDCPVFPAVTRFQASTNPVAIVAGQFNQDAYPDLAVANRGANSISVFLNNGDRTFKSQVEYPTPYGPNALKAADVNRDGRLDLVAGSPGPWGVVTVLLGRGDGTFTPVDAAGASFMISFAVGDFNGDGPVDLIMSQSTGYLTVQFNDGSEKFLSSRDFPSAANIGYMEAADLNADGKLDIVAADFNTRSLIVYLGKGDGAFDWHSSFPLAEPPTFLMVKDLDGDAKIDIIASSYGFDSIWVLFGKGETQFEPAVSFLSGTYPVAFAVADFNGDRKLDLAAAHSFNESVSILRAKGNREFERSAPYTVGGKASFVAAADFDGDGKMDVVVANDPDVTARGAASVAWGKGNGELDAPRQIFRDYLPTGLEPRDIDKDGLTDLVLYSSGLQILHGRENGEFAASEGFMTGYMTSGRAIMDDFNLDGRIDFAIPTYTLPSPPFIFFSTYSALVMVGSSEGTWQATGSAPLTSRGSALAAGDFNHDAKPDLAVVLPDERKIAVFLGKGDSQFQAGVNYSVGSQAQAITLVDANGDTHLDIALSIDAETHFLFGSSNGAFQPAPDSTLPMWMTAFADLNHDSKLDAVGVVSALKLGVRLGNGDGTFRTFQELDLDAYNARPVLGDLNGDGHSDLAVESSAGITTFLGAGDGTFRRHSTHPLGERPESLAIADVTSDGRPDLVVLSGILQRRISILENGCGIEEPKLSVRRRGAEVLLSWPKSAVPNQVEFSTNLTIQVWMPVAEAPEGTELSLPMGGSARYFRLRQPAP